MALGLKYLEAVERAGGIPVVLPPLRPPAIPSLLASLNGLLLSGGPDLDPVAYGAESHALLGPTEPSLDAFEVALARAADRRQIPILGICRGAQALNVARGGSLHQHLPDVTDGSIAHRQTVSGRLTCHQVRIAPASRLATVVGDAPLAVNSFHHQAIDRVGRGLVAVAWAPDGTIEAVEAGGRELVLGVQWHGDGRRPPPPRPLQAARPRRPRPRRSTRPARARRGGAGRGGHLCRRGLRRRSGRSPPSPAGRTGTRPPRPNRGPSVMPRPA